jgi:hypothetical protein
LCDIIMRARMQYAYIVMNNIVLCMPRRYTSK